MINLDILHEVQQERQRLSKRLVRTKTKLLSQKLKHSLETSFYEKFAVEINFIEDNPSEDAPRKIKRLDNQHITLVQKLFIDTFLTGFQSAVDILGEGLFTHID